MATLYIAEYSHMAFDYNSQAVIAPQEPIIASQTVPIAGGSNYSATFNPNTRFVQFHSDAICSYVFGLNNPVATTSNMRMLAGDTKFSGIPVNQGYQLAVIANT